MMEESKDLSLHKYDNNDFHFYLLDSYLCSKEFQTYSFFLFLKTGFRKKRIVCKYRIFRAFSYLEGIRFSKPIFSGS